MSSNLTSIPAGLLDRQASGGDTAGGGFTFQTNALLARLPMWLSRDGFAAIICEAQGDAEAKFFTPGRGNQIELVEAKNHRVAPAEFWREIDRFRQLDQATPGVYGWFTLVSAGLAEDLLPLANGLRRIQGAYAFYGRGNPVLDQSFGAFLDIARRFDRSEADARFIFERVLLDMHQADARDHGEGLFIEAISRWLPEYRNLPLSTLRTVRLALGDLVRVHTCATISRGEIEDRLNQVVQNDHLPESRPISLYTSSVAGETHSGPALVFDWVNFFGGTARSYPPPPEWDCHVLGPLRATRDWIARNRETRRILLQGDRRLSTTFCIGSVFSAVAGFHLEMDYRGEIWRTNSYPDGAAPQYALEHRLIHQDSNHLVVSIGIMRDIVAEVEADLPRHGLEEASVLHLWGLEPVMSAAHANVAAGVMKAHLTFALQSTRANQIDLFYAGPAHQALFLGHRLNATAAVQCYEWVSPGVYTPTCFIN